MALPSDGGDGKDGKRHILVVSYDRESDNTTPVAGLQLSMQATCGAALFSMCMMRLKTMNTTVRVREDGKCDYWYCLMLNMYNVGRTYLVLFGQRVFPPLLSLHSSTQSAGSKAFA